MAAKTELVEKTKGGKCTDGKNHKYGPDNICEKCGFENKTRQYWASSRKEKTPVRQDKLGKAKVRTSLSLLLTGTQSILVGLQPELAPDALNPGEIAMLADVLADEVNESPQLKRWIAIAGKQSTHVRLLVVLVMIVAPRLARRGIIPEGSENVAAAMAVAARGTFDGDRGDELGEIDFDGGGTPTVSEIPGDNQNEDGPLPPPDSVPSSNGHQEGGSIGEPTVRARRTKAKVRGASA